MKYLKLGYYSFDININELGLSSGTPKEFTRDALPDNLKLLYDIVTSNKALEKAVFLRISDNDNTMTYSGFAHQLINNLELSGVDGQFFNASYAPNTNKFHLVYNEF